MGGYDVGAPDRAHAAVRGQHHYWRQGRLQGAVQVGEALDVQHVNLVDEQHSRHQLGHALIDVPVHYLVDL